MRRTLTPLLAALLLAGCAHSDLRMTVMFQDPQGLSVGDDVRIGKERVGEVTALSKADDGVAVDLRISEKHRARVTDGSSFEVERRALLSGEKVLVIEPGVAAPATADGQEG
jgi:ABC-type transporter Mla subunit MlaD